MPDPPRMADFARVLAALDQVTGWDTLGCYRAKVTAMSLALIEGSTLARALYWLATCPSRGGADPGPWEGTAADLLATLRHGCQAAGLATAELPADERVLGRQVREIAPALRRAGVDIRTRKSGPKRYLRITKISGAAAGQ